LLRRACDKTLALVDEFGRGTEPRAAQAAVGALVEELSHKGSHFVVATHLHGVTELPLTIARGQTSPAKWRMGISRPGGLEGNHSAVSRNQEPRWTYALEKGVCRDSFAWHTLRRFGWSEEAVARFHRLLEAGDVSTGSMASALDAPAEDVGSISDMPSLGPATAPGAEGYLLEELGAACGRAASEVVRLGPRDMPPAALAAGCAVLYVLSLCEGRLYVGQTDHLQGRLAKHRRSFGSDLEEVFIVSTGGTAQARRAESLLQRRLQRDGVALVSNHDAAHAHFGLTGLDRGRLWEQDQEVELEGAENVRGAGEAERLRSMARYLAGLADRMEEAGAAPTAQMAGKD